MKVLGLGVGWGRERGYRRGGRGGRGELSTWCDTKLIWVGWLWVQDVWVSITWNRCSRTGPCRTRQLVYRLLQQFSWVFRGFGFKFCGIGVSRLVEATARNMLVVPSLGAGMKSSLCFAPILP